MKCIHPFTQASGIRIGVLVIAVTLTFLQSCAMTGFVARPQATDPDKALCSCLDDLRAARRAGGHIDAAGIARTPLDTHQLESEIRRLALEFPTHVPTLMANAILSSEARDRESEQRYLDRLLALEPGDCEAVVLRSRLALDEGDVPLARRLLEDGMRIAPDRPELQENLAAIEFVAGAFDRARERLAQAERLGAPRWRTAYDGGLIEEAAGDTKAAIQQFTLTLDSRPEFEPARARLRALHALSGTSPH